MHLYLHVPRCPKKQLGIVVFAAQPNISVVSIRPSVVLESINISVLQIGGFEANVFYNW